MRTIGGVIIAVLAGLLYFHTPDGREISMIVDPGQLTIRPSPPGYVCCTLIATGAGTIVVTESFCEVSHAIDRECNKDLKKKEVPK